MNLKSKLSFTKTERELLSQYEFGFQPNIKKIDVLLFETNNEDLAFTAKHIADTYRPDDKYTVIKTIDTGRYWVCPENWLASAPSQAAILTQTEQIKQRFLIATDSGKTSRIFRKLLGSRKSFNTGLLRCDGG